MAKSNTSPKSGKPDAKPTASGFLTYPKAAKRIDTKPTVSGFLPFGRGDMFPQTFRDVIKSSDTATRAIKMIANYIIGNGLADEALADMVVNRDGETLDQVAKGMAWNIAEGEVVILHFGYNGLGKVCSLRSISWEQYRHLEPDERGKLTHGGIFPFLDNSFKKDLKKEHTLCPLFNDDPEVVRAQMGAVGGIQNYYGQLLYLKAGRPSSDYYQEPALFGSVKNLETEAELVDYDFSVAVNGFNSSGIWKQLKKKIDAKDEEDDRDSTTSRLEEHQGGANGGKILVFETEDADELEHANFIPTTGAQLADRYNSTNERIPQRIARRLGVPNELINLRKSGGISPTGQEMAVANKVMQQEVNEPQRFVEQILAWALANWHEPLPSPNPEFNLENLDYFTDQTTSTNAVVPQPG